MDPSDGKLRVSNGFAVSSVDGRSFGASGVSCDAPLRLSITSYDEPQLIGVPPELNVDVSLALAYIDMLRFLRGPNKEF